MYKEHPTFKIERTKGMPLWRYVDFWKFLDLINSSKLFFPNVEMLGDQHEGKVPELIYEAMKANHHQHPSIADDYKNFIENKLRKTHFISSWSANYSESFAMWKMYAKEKLGIGIKTSIDNLKNAFKNVEQDIYIGEVNYYDEKNPKYDVGNAFYTFLNKHKYYEFESEVRCICTLKENDNETFKLIEVDLNELIQEVYISPSADQKGIAEILEFLKQKNGLNFEINISGVNDTWL